MLSSSNNHYNQIFGSEVKSKKQKPHTIVSKGSAYKGSKQKALAQANQRNADKNEQRLLHSLETIVRFRSNLNNKEYQDQYFDENRHKKKDEDEDEEETTPEEF